MPFPPKKQGVGVMIEFGKPKGGPPEPIDSPGEKKRPFAAEKMPMHEAAEPPKQEVAEERSADIGTELDSISEVFGLDAASGRAFLKEALKAVLKTLGGDEESAIAEHDAGGENNEYGEAS